MEETSREAEGRTAEALIVFGKVPQPGAVKTRLSPPLSPEQAALLYEAFLRDALAAYRRHPVDCLFFLGPAEPALPEGLVPDGVTVYPQRGDGLGERMSNAFRASFEAGYERLVLIGTDHPTLPPAYVGRAFRALGSSVALSIGPSEDGGFYLLGMNRYFPELFHGMRYSHAAVFEETRARADRTGAHLTILPEWYDVDTPAELERLKRDLEDPDVEAPHTRRILSRLGL